MSHPVISFNQITHPEYSLCELDWEKWRLCYHGGRDFIERYLNKYSSLEDTEDFANRKKVSYCPRFSGAALDDVKNAIYQRMSEIKRIGGTASYHNACLGYDNGVDLFGNSMNAFIGCKVLPELLLMGKVGVYVDMPPMTGTSLIDNLHARPYLYLFTAEDIRSWDYDYQTSEFTSVLLRSLEYTYDEQSGLPSGECTTYRRFWKENGVVYVEFYDDKGERESEQIQLDINKIPFVCGSISNSLMKDIADYQIALLNLASSDLSFALKVNFPFYVEQFDPRTEMMTSFLRQSSVGSHSDTTDDGTAAVAAKSVDKHIKVGATTGRRYPAGLEQPNFIHPSTDPLKASMEKQKQLKEEIRQLLNLSLSNLRPQRASAESKQQDDTGLEAGLSYIGLTLQIIEQQIGQIWSLYENSKYPPTIKYPEKYQLRTEQERRAEAAELFNQMEKIPSHTAQKEICKAATTILLDNKINEETMTIIYKEIDGSPNTSADPEVLKTDVELGLVSKELASELRGYPKGEAEKAKDEHVERAQAIALAQSNAAVAGVGAADNPGARGVSDLAVDKSASSKAEKAASRDTTMSVDQTSKVRGDGKNAAT